MCSSDLRTEDIAVLGRDDILRCTGQVLNRLGFAAFRKRVLAGKDVVPDGANAQVVGGVQIGRASCRERV